MDPRSIVIIDSRFLGGQPADPVLVAEHDVHPVLRPRLIVPGPDCAHLHIIVGQLVGIARVDIHTHQPCLALHRKVNEQSRQDKHENHPDGKHGNKCRIDEEKWEKE